MRFLLSEETCDHQWATWQTRCRSKKNGLSRRRKHRWDRKIVDQPWSKLECLSSNSSLSKHSNSPSWLKFLLISPSWWHLEVTRLKRLAWQTRLNRVEDPLWSQLRTRWQGPSSQRLLHRLTIIRTRMRSNKLTWQLKAQKIATLQTRIRRSKSGHIYKS